MRDARPADLGHALDGGRAEDEVDRDCVRIAGNGERRGLARNLDERFEVRSNDRPDVEPSESCVPELDEADAETVATGARLVFDEARSRQRREEA
jgi:hypothetical protein